MPLLSNSRVCDLLLSNFNLSKQILKSNFKKLQRNQSHLKMYNEVFKNQLDDGIIERIEDLPEFLVAHPNASFLSHIGVFSPDHDSTKCRIVYLFNICEINKLKSKTINHNQAMMSGPNLNKKISTSLIKLRFDKYLLCFDVKKAFLNAALSPVDQKKLLFLWYRNIDKNDYILWLHISH